MQKLFDATALIIASDCGHLSIVKYLVSKGAKLENTKPFGNETALYVAAIHGYKQIVTFLAQNGANVNTCV